MTPGMGKHLKKPVSLRLGADDMALLELLARRYGGKQAAIVAGLNLAAKRPGLSKEVLLAEIARRLK